MIEGGLLYQGIIFVFVFAFLAGVMIFANSLMAKEGKREGEH